MADNNKVVPSIIEHLRKLEEISKDFDCSQAFVLIYNVVHSSTSEKYITSIMKRAAWLICQKEYNIGNTTGTPLYRLKDMNNVIEKSLLIYSHLDVGEVARIANNESCSICDSNTFDSLVTAFAKMYK